VSAHALYNMHRYYGRIPGATARQSICQHSADGFKLRRGCRELTLRANLRAAPAANHALSSLSLEPASRPIAQSHVNDATLSLS